MNFLVEGLQGSGKSTLVNRLAALYPACSAYREGDYSPIELAWCAYVDGAQYRAILEKYPELREQIERKTVREGERFIVCCTKIRTDNRGFYRDLEQYEIYNGRVPWDFFQALLLRRYAAWREDGTISECALFQNTVEEMLLFVSCMFK